MIRDTVEKHHIERGLADIRHMLLRRLEKHGTGSFASPHEALGIIKEEESELVEQIRLNHREHISSEMMDVAVAALFGYICNEYAR